MSVDELKTLRCPRCGGGADVPTWLDHAQAKVTSAGTIPVRCPRCRGDLHVEIDRARAAVGSLSESTPRMFRPETRLAQPGLELTRSPNAVCVRWRRREWWFEVG